MEVGSLRERIIVALLTYKFGQDNVVTDMPITEREVDVKLFGKPISIKTISNRRLTGVKLSWTVDSAKAREFREGYDPGLDMLLVQIVWEGPGGLFYIPVHLQKWLFGHIGREQYIKLPKPGTNPRGVEITQGALSMLVAHTDCKKIAIRWERRDVEYDPYARWVDLWAED